MISTPEELEGATHVIVPGVGHFSQAIQHLRAHKLADPVVNRVNQGLPTLFVCVGLQLLGIGSEEGGFSEIGLSIIHEKVHKFPSHVRVPQQGWNRVVPSGPMHYIEEGYAYFSNSYCFKNVPMDQGWTVAYPLYCNGVLLGI